LAAVRGVDEDPAWAGSREGASEGSAASAATATNLIFIFKIETSLDSQDRPIAHAILMQVLYCGADSLSRIKKV